MPQTTTAIDSLETTLDRLARLESSPVPFVSLYLNLRADAQGKDNYQSFVRKELPARARTFAAGSPERDSLDRDIARIQQYLEAEVPASANGLALFASAGRDGLFEALVLEVGIDQHRLSIAAAPQLAPLALLLDQHPRHALVLADSHAARIFVFDAGTVSSAQVAGEKIRRSSGGGWSQARYQRRHDNLKAEHARELVQTLERLVRDEGIEHVVLAGDEVNVPLVKRELSKELDAKVIDVVRLEPRAPVQEVMAAAAEAMRRHDARTDAEAVASVLDEYRSGGLGVAGPEATRDALVAGQVDELYLTAATGAGTGDGGTSGTSPDELVALAAQTAATTRFIEDPALLAGVGGVAAALRFRMKPVPAEAADNARVKGAAGR
jgi:peptide subunit release factor 1 (eRF1)